MSDNDIRSHDDIRTDAAARALDALEPREAEAVDAAARESAALRNEIDGFAGTAAQLGLAARPVAPPAALRARLLADIARTPQLPADRVDETADAGSAAAAGSPDPAVRSAATAGAAADATAGAAPSTGSIGTVDAREAAREAAPAPASATTSATGAGPAEARARARWYARPGLVLGSAAAALAMFAGGVAFGTSFLSEGPRAEAEADALAELYAAPDAQRRSADVEGDGTATLVWSEQLDRSVVVFDALEPLPEDSVYEAWYINSAGTATPAGTFRTEAEGLVYHLLDGSLGRGGTIGVTVEPEPGSEAPTTKPIVLLSRA